MAQTEPFEIPELKIIPVHENERARLLSTLIEIPYHSQYNRRIRTAPDRGILQEEAETFMDYCVAGALSKLAERFPRRDRNWCEYADRKCVFTYQIIKQALAALPAGNLHAFNMQRLSGIPHTAIIIHLPVRAAKSSTRFAWKDYLIDPTFCQFFYNPETGGNDRAIGQNLVANPRGREFASTLLEKGFIELTSQRAKIYVNTFLPMRYNSVVRQKLSECNGSYIALLQHPDFNQSIER